MGVSSRWFSISLRPLRPLRLKPLKEDRQREFRFDVTICDIKTSFSGAEKNALPTEVDHAQMRADGHSGSKRWRWKPSS